MFLARREFGKLARVYEIRVTTHSYFWPSAWMFRGGKPRDDGSVACGPGHCAIGATFGEALQRLHANDEQYERELGMAS